MKNIIGIAVAAMAAISMASPAMAQDSDSESFEGPRVGALAGITGEDISAADSSLTYGAVIGYDLAVTDNVLIGAEADAVGFDDNATNSQLSVAVRASYAVNDRVAVFGSAGYTSLFVQQTFRSFPSPIEPIRVPIASVGLTALPSGTTSNTIVSRTEIVQYDGYRVGGGVEVKLNDTIYATGEYRYSNFDFGGFGNSDVHSALVGIGVRF